MNRENKYKKIDIKPNEIICQSAVFFGAARLLGSSLQYLTPKNFLYVHSLELSLKAILAQVLLCASNGGKGVSLPKTHSLSDVWKRILDSDPDFIMNFDTKEPELYNNSLRNFFFLVDKYQNSIMSRYNDGDEKPIYLCEDVFRPFVEFILCLSGYFYGKKHNVSYIIPVCSLNACDLFRLKEEVQWDKFKEKMRYVQRMQC